MGTIAMVWDQCTLEVNLGNEDVLIPDCWYVPDKLRTGASNLGSVNAPPPLEHRQSGVGWSKKGIYDV